MTLSNVKLILAREVRDQLRDRRTLFMIAVLPILLYPLLGVSLLQVSQFMQEQPTRVLVVGAENLAAAPPLFENQQFSEWLFADPSRAKLINLSFAPILKGGAAAGETPGPTLVARWSREPSRRRCTSPRTFPPGSTPSARRLAERPKTVQ